MLTKKRKIIVLAGMLGLLVITGVLNVVLNNIAPGPDTGTAGGSHGCFFADYRALRTQTREETLLHLNAVIANASTSSQARTDAETTRLTIIQNMEKELILEGLIKAMGFNDAVVSTNNDNVNVIVRTFAGTDNIEEHQAAQILDIVIRETGTSAQRVRIIPVEN